MASNGSQKTTLESLPADVARMIVEEIHDGEDSSLFPFSTVSKACRSQCEPLLFRSIKLHSKGRAAYQTTQHIIKRLQNPSDSLRIHVRHLIIGRFKESHLPSPETLVDIIQALRNLQSLSWNTYFAIPSEVLEALRIHRPSAQLNAKSHLRRRFPSDNPLRLDEALLSSPQLHSLDIGIMCLEYGQDGNDKGSSELQILKEKLIQGGSLKNLCLRFESIKCRSLETIYQLDTSKPAVYKPMHIPFQPGDKFPPLQELTLILADKSSSPAYNFTPSHCRLWRSCMDWSHLRSLKLVAKEPRYVVMSTPKNLLIELTGLVPQLQTFHLCGFSSMGTNLERFLKAVTRLEDVHLDNSLYVEFSADLNIILDAQGRNLKRVELVCGSVSMAAWNKEKYLDFLKRCGSIEFLSTKLGMNGKYVGHGEWDEDRCGGTPEEKFADMYIKGLPSEYVPRSGFDGAMGFTIGRYGQLVPWGEEE